MINGKFFTGLPPKMIDRSGGLNRQQTNFFWPDDTQNQSSVESKVKRRGSLQAQSRQAYTPAAAVEQSNSDAENKERFKKEFTRSSIQFYDNVEETPLRRNRQRTGYQPPPVQKQQNVEPPFDTSGKRKEVFASKIEFYDYAEDLNNARRTDKNNKAEVERNTKNSPKLQNKQLSFDPPDEAVNFIENDVRNMRIGAPPRRRNPPRQPRMPPRDEPRVSDFAEDYPPPQRRLPVLPPPPLRSRYSESDPDFDDYTPRRVPLGHRKPPAYFDNIPDDFIDAPQYLQSPPHLPLRYNEGMTAHRRTGRQVHFTYSDNDHDYTPQQTRTSRVHVLKVDNDVRSSEHQQPPTSPSGATATSGPSHKHLVSNICFSDTESASATPPCPQKRNIRSSAVNRVSVGLPD